MPKIRFKHYGTVNKKGFLDLENRQMLEKELLKHIGKRVYLTVTRFRKARSSGKPEEDGNQNGYYFGVVLPIVAMEQGQFPDQTHHDLKRKFLRTGGTDEFPICKESSDLSTVEWEEWMTAIRTWASMELNAYIPLPNEAEGAHDR